MAVELTAQEWDDRFKEQNLGQAVVYTISVPEAIHNWLTAHQPTFRRGQLIVNLIKEHVARQAAAERRASRHEQ